MTEQIREYKILENGKLLNYEILTKLIRKCRYFNLYGIIGSTLIFEVFDYNITKVGEIHIELWSKQYKGTLYDILSNPWFICFSVTKDRPLPITKEFIWWLEDLITWRYVDNLIVYIKENG